MSIDNKSLEEICKELDDLSLRMLQLLKEYISIKLNIEGQIKTGNIHLAKSRYIMGNKSVSALQLPSEDSNEITAATTVISKKNGVTDDDVLTLELSRLSINNKNCDESKLRQRYNKNRQNENEEQEDGNKLPERDVQDPLKWFGVLLPQDMRQAQSCYNKAIEHIVECANIQFEIFSVEEKYKKYLLAKNELMEK